MRSLLKKFAEILNIIFGYGIMIVLFSGGMTFFGYLAALCIGGSIAETICIFIYKQIIPVIVYSSTCLILLGLISMYLAGEKALVSSKKN